MASTLISKQLKKIKILKLITIQNFDIYVVNAELIRDTLDIDFTTGGNPSRYKYIPENEIWVEAHLTPNDLWPCIIHEFMENYAMSKFAYSYDKAHDYANLFEKKVRSLILKDKFKVDNYYEGAKLANKMIKKVMKKLD